MTRTGKTKNIKVPSSKFNFTKTFEEVKGRKREHLVTKGEKKRPDPLRRNYAGWVCANCSTWNYFLSRSCSNCGRRVPYRRRK